jgi:hypothetical protein
MNAYTIGLLFVFFVLVIIEIHYYRKGWGLNFHILDLKEQDAWVKPFPTQFERIWLLVVIIAETILLLIMALPLLL